MVFWVIFNVVQGGYYGSLGVFRIVICGYKGILGKKFGSLTQRNLHISTV